MADALEQKINQLEEGVRRRDEFVNNFTHELRTPLTSIIGYADMLRSRQLLTEEVFSCADFIFREGKRLEAVGARLMDIVVMKNTELRPHWFEAKDFFSTIAEVTVPLCAENEIELVMETEDCRIYGEEDLLKILVLNLIDNGKKASTPRQKLLVTGKRTETGYHCTVRDFGSGMPAEVLAHIGEPFYMADQSRSRAKGGVGLGLALCFEIARLHQGNLELESEPGKGTVATFFLPEIRGAGEESE